jgi:hypothetical protein
MTKGTTSSGVSSQSLCRTCVDGAAGAALNSVLKLQECAQQSTNNHCATVANHVASRPPSRTVGSHWPSLEHLTTRRGLAGTTPVPDCRPGTATRSTAAARAAWTRIRAPTVKRGRLRGLVRVSLVDSSMPVTRPSAYSSILRTQSSTPKNDRQQRVNRQPSRRANAPAGVDSSHYVHHLPEKPEADSTTTVFVDALIH